MRKKTQDLVVAALMLALTQLLPLLLSGNIPDIAKRLSPMHIPVLLCGFLCGFPWAPVVGFIAPLLRSVTVGMPVMFPNGIAMAFELCTYGLVSGMLYRLLPRGNASVFASLIGAMLAGRLVWGLASAILYGLNGTSFTLSAFLAGALFNAVPGIVFHILIIPAIVLGLKNAKILKGV